MDTKEWIKFYHDSGVKYSDILQNLQDHHGVNISLRTLKTYIQDLGLVRYNKYSLQFSLNIVEMTIRDSPSSNLGYRMLRQRIWVLYGIKLSVRQVLTALRIIDPVGVQTRRANRLQRRIYTVSSPNHSQHIGIMSSNVGPGSHRYTTSQRNQRIESFWSQLRRGGMTYLMDYFRSLEFADVVNFSDPHELALIRFCFMSYIQYELNVFRQTWNMHRIRSQRYTNVPSGIPQSLHFQNPQDEKIVCPPDILEIIRSGLPERNNYRTGVFETDAAFHEVSRVLNLDVNPTSLRGCEIMFVALKRYFEV